jgi:Zn-dependent M28 family amino/carboxypeptidase
MKWCIVALAVVTLGAEEQTPTASRLKETIEVLSSPGYGGRKVGTESEIRARDYLVTALQSRGLAPVHAGSYVVPFKGTAGGASLSGYHVAGIVKGTVAKLAQSVMIGAHYDHLGPDAEAKLRPGADDNASGVAAVLEIASRAKSIASRTRDIVVVLWSGEESGCAGSRASADALIASHKPAAYLNLDMVGRNDSLNIEGTASGDTLAGIVNTRTAKSSLKIKPSPWFDKPTDVYTFANRRVPSLNFSTGLHTDYHKPTDTADQIKLGQLELVTDLVTRILGDLVNGTAPAFHRPAGAKGTCGE